jgi:hypothetical protein
MSAGRMERGLVSFLRYWTSLGESWWEFYVPLTTAETAKVRRRVVVFCWRATRARDWRCGLVSYDVAHKRGA